jgi:hypothetical protein
MNYIICKVIFFCLLAQNISGASDIDQKALEKIVDSFWTTVQELKGINDAQNERIDAQNERIDAQNERIDVQDEQIALLKHHISLLKVTN